MEDMRTQRLALAGRDELAKKAWLPLSLSGIGAAAGAVGFYWLLLALLGEKLEKGILVFALLNGVFAAFFRILHVWLVPLIKIEIGLAWGTPLEKMAQSGILLVKGLAFGALLALLVLMVVLPFFMSGFR
jgi:hypothetical protein